MQAKVKLWNSKKGFGFLDNGVGPDVFVAKNELKGCSYLRVGAKVEFECHISTKGLVAKRVSLVKQEAGTNRQNTSTKSWHGVMT